MGKKNVPLIDLALGWSDCFGSGSIIIYISSTDEGLWDILIKDIPKEVTSYTLNLDMLREGVTYDFRVIAVNDYGYGSPSAPSPSIAGEESRTINLFLLDYIMFPYICFYQCGIISWISSSEGLPFLWGVVVSGGDSTCGTDIHPPACLYPHHPGAE